VIKTEQLRRSALERASLGAAPQTNVQPADCAGAAGCWARIAMKRKWFILAIIIILIALVWLFREGMTSHILPEK
jgi:t-SNARE complex subunit (syntaxin)